MRKLPRRLSFYSPLYREARGDIDDAYESYFHTLVAWCAYKPRRRRMKAGKEICRISPDVVVQHRMAMKIIEIAKEDLGDDAATDMWNEFAPYWNARIGEQAGIHNYLDHKRLNVFAWSPNETSCILCGRKRHRNLRGGKCTGCIKASEYRETQAVRILDGIIAVEGGLRS